MQGPRAGRREPGADGTGSPPRGETGGPGAGAEGRGGGGWDIDQPVLSCKPENKSHPVTERGRKRNVEGLFTLSVLQCHCVRSPSDAEKLFEPILYTCVCVTINTILKLLLTSTLTRMHYSRILTDR